MTNVVNRIAARPGVLRAVLIGLLVLLQVLIVAVAFMGGYLFGEWQIGEEQAAARPMPVLQQVFQSNPEFGLVSEAFKLLKENALFPLPEDNGLQYGMIRGLLQVYDEPFTTFVEPPQHELQTNQLQGKFGGIGVRIERDGENRIVLFPLPDSPALKAGVLDGDRLLKVEELVITPETPTDTIQAAVRGPVGQKVTITVGHSPDYEPVALTIERAEVALPSVTWNLATEDETVGVIQVRVIAEPTPREVTQAIEDLQAKGATRFVLDLRNNGGGLVEAGVNTARLFLKSGKVIEQEYRGQPVKSFTVEKPGAFANLPVVVLINQGTASAAEIVAGALKGHQRAPVVGSPSYGKDTIQLVFSLSDGSSLHVTAAHWWVPGLEPKIGESGVQPDVSIPADVSEGEALARAVEAVLQLKP